jgi:CheY-like chemotaxis protein
MKKLNCVLLVDDDLATNFLHSVIVEDARLTDCVATAESGEAALGYLAQCGDPTDSATARPFPELIFLDINMPGMNGWEFLAEYDQLPMIQTEEIVIVMLTASPNPDDESKAGTFPRVKEYRRKPMTTEMLEDIVGRYFTG